MEKQKTNLYLREEAKLDGIINVFEKESPIIQTIVTLKQYVNKVIIMGIICILLIILIQRYSYITSIFISIFLSLFIIISVYKKAYEVTYTYSRKLGGKRAKHFFSKEEGILQTIAYNLKLMQEEEWNLVNKILKINHLNNIKCIGILKDYFFENSPKEKYETKKFIGNFTSVYLIPITAIIISAYTAIFNNLNLQQNILDITYIIIGAIIILVVIILIYKIYKIKTFSFTNSYTFSRLYKILTELLLERNRKTGMKTKL